MVERAKQTGYHLSQSVRLRSWRRRLRGVRRLPDWRVPRMSVVRKILQQMQLAAAAFSQVRMTSLLARQAAGHA